MKLEKNTVEELAQLIERYELTEIEVQNGDTRITLKKTPAILQVGMNNQVIPVAGIQNGMNASFRRITENKAQQDELEMTKTASKSRAKKRSELRDTKLDGQNYVTSPIAGIFYRQSQPGKAPFVEVGQRVKAGDVVCLVEAMKMVNEVATNHDGVVKEIMVDDEQFVECGAQLILIEEE